MKTEFRKDIRDIVKGISDQFIDHYVGIGEKYQETYFIQEMMMTDLVSEILFSIQTEIRYQFLLLF